MQRRDSNLSVEPAVRAAGANRTMAQKNSRATQNWMKAKTSIDRERVKAARGLEENRTKLLKQRERLQNTSLSLTSTPRGAEGSVDENADDSKVGAVPSSRKLLSLADVYAELMKSMKKSKEADLMSYKSEPVDRPSLMSGTRSFQLKRVGRKPINFSLQKLQRMNSNLSQAGVSVTNEEEAVEGAVEVREKSEQLGVFDLNEEERSLGPTLKLPPMCLPPIARSVSFEPKARNFQKDRAEVKSSLQSNFDDVRYCRYLRVASGYRRNSSPAPIPPQRYTAWKQ